MDCLQVMEVKAGMDPLKIKAEFGDRIAAYLEGRGTAGQPSTVVDLTGPAPRVLRRGPVEWEAL